MKPPIPNHTTTIDLLFAEWDALAAITAKLTERQWRTPTALPGWSVFDVMAHVTGTELSLLGEKPPALPDGVAKVDVRTLPHVHNQISIFNEVWVQRLRPLTGTQLRQRFSETITRRKKFLTELSDTEWATLTSSPLGEVAYGRFMVTRFFDCWLHELDIADALGISVDEGGPRGECAFDDFIGWLPRALVKKAKAPQGSRIAFTVTEPINRSLRIVVDNRAEYVDEFEEDPTVDIELTWSQLVRLGGGRIDPETVLEKISYTGDLDLGKQILRDLAFIM